MTTKASGEFDYGMLADLIIDSIKKITDCGTVETDYSGPQQAYPFFSYKITTPYIAIVQQMNNSEMFELTVSIDCHADNSIQSLQLATRLAKHLKSNQVRSNWRERNVIVVDINSFGNRSIFQIDDYERITGFDLRLRVSDNFEEKRPEVTKVNVDGKTTNNN